MPVRSSQIYSAHEDVLPEILRVRAAISDEFLLHRGSRIADPSGIEEPYLHIRSQHFVAARELIRLSEFRRKSIGNELPIVKRGRKHAIRPAVSTVKGLRWRKDLYHAMSAEIVAEQQSALVVREQHRPRRSRSAQIRHSIAHPGLRLIACANWRRWGGKQIANAKAHD